MNLFKPPQSDFWHVEIVTEDGSKRTLNTFCTTRDEAETVVGNPEFYNRQFQERNPETFEAIFHGTAFSSRCPTCHGGCWAFQRHRAQTGACFRPVISDELGDVPSHRMASLPAGGSIGTGNRPKMQDLSPRLAGT